MILVSASQQRGGGEMVVLGSYHRSHRIRGLTGKLLMVGLNNGMYKYS